VFRDHGLDVLRLSTEEAAERIQARSVPRELVAALQEWARVRRSSRPKADTTWKVLLTIARAADPDDWRNRLRKAWEEKDKKVLTELAASNETAAQLPSTFNPAPAGRSPYRCQCK
jgi:hypothetical protein